jgi:hypothetical protein
VLALSKAGYKEITLLGQNVNSYRYTPPAGDAAGDPNHRQQQQQQQQHGIMSKGFSTIYKPPPTATYDFADLVQAGRCDLSSTFNFKLLSSLMALFVILSLFLIPSASCQR